ncbi:MAG: energy transducer TonB [Alistipes sp.]|nr:energy transducer TonB [Alistipes sp.]
MKTNNQNTAFEELNSRVEQMLTPRFAPSAEEICLPKTPHKSRTIWLNTLRIGGVAAALAIGIFFIVGPYNTVTANGSIMVEEIVQAIDAHDNTSSAQPDTEPKFKGGDLTKFAYWVQEQIEYPKEAFSQGIGGKVVAEFFIEKDGSVTFSKILESPNEILSKEVERVIKLSPKWEPAIQKGQKVRVKFAIPVAFAIFKN